MSNFLVDAIGNIERDYDPDIKESAKTEKLKFTEPKLSDEVRYNTNIPYDKIGKIDNYIDKYESETLKVSDSLSFSEYDEKYKGKEVISVTEGMSKHATEVYETLKMEHKELSYSEKDKILFIENSKKEFFDEKQLETITDIDEKLGKIYDDVANNIEKLPPEYGISMNKAINEYKELLNVQTGQDPEAIKNILTMHYNNLIAQLNEKKILTGPELELLNSLDQEAIDYYNKKYVESNKGELESTKFNSSGPNSKSKPTAPRDGFTLSSDSLLSDENGKNTKFNKDKIESESKVISNLDINTDTLSTDSVIKGKVSEFNKLIDNNTGHQSIKIEGSESTYAKPLNKDEVTEHNLNSYEHVISDSNYQKIKNDNGITTYAEPLDKDEVNSTEINSYNKLTHKNDNNDNYQVINNSGKSTTYAEVVTDKSDTRSNNIYMEYIAMKEGIPEDYGIEQNQKDFWDYYSGLDFSSVTSLITSGASELAKLSGMNSEKAEKYENNVSNVLDRTGVDIMINNSIPGKILGGTSFYVDLAAKIIKNKDKLTFENYLFATTYLYYLTPIRPDIGPSGYNKTGKDWSILGYTDGGLSNKIASVAKNIGKSFLDTATGGLIKWESNNENYGASKFINDTYDNAESKGISIDSNIVDTSRLRKLDFSGTTKLDKRDVTYIKNSESNDPNDSNDSNRSNYLFNNKYVLRETSSIVPGILGKNEKDSSTDNFKLHLSELDDEIFFKGRSVIKAAQDNGFMINNQFNWDIKLEPLFRSIDYNSDDLISEYCKSQSTVDGCSYNVPNIADYLGPNWLPVTDFNISFTTNSVSQVQIGTGINIPIFNKVEFPSTLSMSIYESNALAIKQWLYHYQRVIYNSTGGSINRPYQFAASKCYIYLWSVNPIKNDIELANALNKKPTGSYYDKAMSQGILRRYVLYVVPINFDLQINGAGAPSLESRSLNFTIVGSERGFSILDPQFVNSRVNKN